MRRASPTPPPRHRRFRRTGSFRTAVLNHPWRMFPRAPHPRKTTEKSTPPKRSSTYLPKQKEVEEVADEVEISHVEKSRGDRGDDRPHVGKIRQTQEFERQDTGAVPFDGEDEDTETGVEVRRHRDTAKLCVYAYWDIVEKVNHFSARRAAPSFVRSNYQALITSSVASESPMSCVHSRQKNEGPRIIGGPLREPVST